MSNKVRLSNVDRGINAITAFNTYKNTKISEQILIQQLKNNEHLSDMQRQLVEANETNRQILQNQIREIEYKEKQKYYKAFSFNIYEVVNYVETINDSMILSYVMDNYYDKLKSDLIMATDFLDEINDKLFNKQILEKLNSLKLKTDANLSSYLNNVLSKIDTLVDDLNELKEKVDSLQKPEFTDELEKREINEGRILFIVALGIVLCVVPAGLFSDGVIETNYVLFVILIGAVFAYLIYREFMDRNEFAKKKKQYNAEKEDFEKNKVALEQQYEKEILQSKEKILLHPAYSAMEEINIKHPTFEQTISNISDIETTFIKKW